LSTARVGHSVASMARAFRYVQVDVFTDRIFGGNQLAVFLEPEGLSADEMQSIAREMNFAETTFVFDPTVPRALAKVRIFTPSRELPFAGHPTVGTAWVLANQGRLPDGAREAHLEEGIGLVRVRVEGDLRAPETVWMSHQQPEFGPPVQDRAAVAEALGLTEADLLGDVPICTGSTGVTFLYVPLASPDAVDRARANTRALEQPNGVFVFAPDAQRGTNRVYSRMFGAEALGVVEDAATGSASGPLGALVAEKRVVSLEDGPVEIVSLQGNRMGRPSTIRIRLDLASGRASNVQVGGGVVRVAEGALTLPT
jgi:trans-2,3-dihydro-3-hydroxyanthranilate isomerase